jgi:hypothetical protein
LFFGNPSNQKMNSETGNAMISANDQPVWLAKAKTLLRM